MSEIRLATPEEVEAIRAFEAKGITPTVQSVWEWLEQRRKPQAAPEQQGSAEQSSPAESSTPRKGVASLARFAADQTEATKPKRKPGRPRTIASWFPAVAQTMADGTSLRTALAVNGLHLSASEIRALYRNRTFQPMYQEARRRYFIENYGRKPTLRALVGRYV